MKRELDLINITTKPQPLDDKFEAIMDKAAKQEKLARLAPELLISLIAATELLAETAPSPIIKAAVIRSNRLLYAPLVDIIAEPPKGLFNPPG